MGQYQEEIKQELEKISKKYNIVKGILLMEEQSSETPDQTQNRVIIFQPDMTDTQKFSIHDFGEMYEKCLHISSTFRNIVNHMAEHLIEKVIGQAIHGQGLEDSLKKGGKRAD